MQLPEGSQVKTESGRPLPFLLHYTPAPFVTSGDFKSFAVGTSLGDGSAVGTPGAKGGAGVGETVPVTPSLKARPGSVASAAPHVRKLPSGWPRSFQRCRSLLFAVAGWTQHGSDRPAVGSRAAIAPSIPRALASSQTARPTRAPRAAAPRSAPWIRGLLRVHARGPSLCDRRGFVVSLRVSGCPSFLKPDSISPCPHRARLSAHLRTRRIDVRVPVCTPFGAVPRGGRLGHRSPALVGGGLALPLGAAAAPSDSAPAARDAL